MISSKFRKRFDGPLPTRAATSSVFPLRTQIIGVPDPPTDFDIIGAPTESGGEFTWVDPVYTGASPLESYKLYVRAEGAGSFTMLANPSFGTAPPYLDETLNPGTQYYLYVTAINAHGESGRSNILTITTTGGGRPGGLFGNMFGMLFGKLWG